MNTYDIDSTTDLFQAQETLPDNIRAILDKYAAQHEQPGVDGYQLCREMLEEMEANGYTFDYGLDGVPYDLQVIESED